MQLNDAAFGRWRLALVGQRGCDLRGFGVTLATIFAFCLALPLMFFAI
jgi:hypothetical protein